MPHRRSLGVFASGLIVCLCALLAITRVSTRAAVVWADTDIGSPPAPGKTTNYSGSLTVSGAGTGIAGLRDQFHFYNTAASGDLDIRVRLGSLRGDPGMEAGLTVRQSLHPAAAQASLLYSPLTGLNFIVRTTNGAEAMVPARLGSSSSVYLRLVRTGGAVAAYYSTDGSVWTLIKRASVAMPVEVVTGIAVAGSAAVSVPIATFAGLSLSTTPWPNQPPTVSLTSPAAGAAFDLPATFAMTAMAADVDGRVAAVEFLVNGVRVGRVTLEPYRIFWAAPAAGSYTLQAVAFDDDGAGTTSTAVTVTVRSSVSLPSIAKTSLQFAPSADHEQLVKFYRLEIRLAADSLSRTPIEAVDLGKPAIVAGTITADVTNLFGALPSGEYYAVVKAVGDGGAGVSEKLPFSW